MFSRKDLPLKNDMYEQEIAAKSEQVCIEFAELSAPLPPEIGEEVKKIILQANAYFAYKCFIKHSASSEYYNIHTNVASEKYQSHRVYFYKNYIEIQKISEAFYIGKNYLHCNYTLVKKVANKLFYNSNVEDMGGFRFAEDTLQMNKLLNVLYFNHFLYSELKYYNKPIDIAMLYGMLTPIKGSELCSIGRGMFLHQSHLSGLPSLDDIDSPDFYRKYLHMQLDIILSEINFMKKHMKPGAILKNIQKHALRTRQYDYHSTPLPRYGEFVLQELVIHGKLARGAVKDIIGKKTRTATTLISQLLKTGYIKSPSRNGEISLKINRELAKDLFPGLFKKAQL